MGTLGARLAAKLAERRKAAGPGGALGVLGTAAKGLDLPRRAVATAGYMLGGFNLEEALQQSESGEGLIRMLAPKFARDRPIASMFAGVAQEITADPLNLLLGVGVTTKGIKAMKAGKLGLTWGEQVARGERAFLRLAYPSLKGGFHIERAVVLRAPKVVNAMAATGKFLGRYRPFSWFRSGALNPHVRAAKRVADQVLLDPDNPTRSIMMKLEASREAVDVLSRQFGPEGWQSVTRAAEHIDPATLLARAGPGHSAKLGQFTSEVIEGAKRYQAHISTAIDILEGAGLKAPKQGGSIAQAIRSTKAQRGQYLNDMIAVLSKKEQAVIKDAVTWGDHADDATKAMGVLEDHIAGQGSIIAAAQAELDNLADLSKSRISAAAKPVFGTPIGTEAGRIAALRHSMGIPEGARYYDPTVMPRVTQLESTIATATRNANELRSEWSIFERQYLAADAKAAVRRTKSLRITDKMEGVKQGLGEASKKIREYDEKLTGLARLQEQIPSFVPRYLSEPMRHSVMSKVGVQKKLSKVTFTNDLHGRIERHFVDQFHSATLEKLSPYQNMRNSIKAMKVPLDLDDIGKLVAKDLPGTRIPEFQRIARGGIADRLTAWYRGLPAEPQLKNLYNFELGKNYRRFTDHIVESIRGKGFMDAVLDNPALARSLKQFPGGVPEKGWVHIKELSSAVADYAAKNRQMGDVWLHPDAFGEFRRVYSEVVNPESTSRFLRAYDKYTKAFKFMVTAPWPAYHWRNNFSDFVLMGYNGEFSPMGVVKNGIKAMRGKADDLIDCGRHLGKLPADEVRRLAIAQGVMFGEQASIGGLKGKWAKITQFPENSRRAGYFVDRLQRGFSPIDAALATKKVLFDYSELGTDARTLKRIIPFWSWLQHNTRRQMETLISAPAIISHQMRLGSSVEKLEGVPAWMRGRMMIALGKDDQTGEERMLTGLGLPVEDIAELLDFNGGPQEWVRQLTFRINPVLKLSAGAASYAAGRPYDIERGRPMDRPTNAPYLRWLYESAPKPIVEFAERVFDARKRKSRAGQTYYTISPGWDFALRNLPTTRAYSTAKQWGREGAPLAAAIAPKLTQDNMTMAEWFDRLARTTTGYAVIPYDRRKEGKREERRNFESTLRSLRRKGDVGFITVPYRTRGSQLPRSEFHQLLRAGRR